MGGVGELVLEQTVFWPAPKPQPVGYEGNSSAYEAEGDRGDCEDPEVWQRVGDHVHEVGHERLFLACEGNVKAESFDRK